jgi:hypothetical protein
LIRLLAQVQALPRQTDLSQLGVVTTGLPSLPLEVLSGVMAGAATLVGAHAGLLAAAALLGLLVITIPLVRVEDAGGILDSETRPDGGTRSRVMLPIEPPA